MSKSLSALIAAAIAIAIGAPSSIARSDPVVKIGVGSQGPISPQAMAQIEQVIAELPGVKVVPIVPPGDLTACVRRFVAGDPEDRLDGLITVTLPPDSFKVERDAHEASFTGSYEIHTLDLTTLAEDRHSFNFTDSEPVTGGMSAILAIPANLLAERTTGTALISGNAWQAFQAVQARIESKLVVATRLYLATATIRAVRPLDPLQCAQRLLDAGEVDTAMAVFKSVGAGDPRVDTMIVQARQKIGRTRAETMLAKTLGAIAGGDARAAGAMLASYEKEPAAEGARADSLRRAIDAIPEPARDGSLERVLRSDLPILDRAALVAMVKEVFSEQTGTEPAEVEIAAGGVEVADHSAEAGIKTRLDGYAAALGKCAWLLALKCGCDATATLKGDQAGAVLLRAQSGPSSARPQVGIP